MKFNPKLPDQWILLLSLIGMIFFSAYAFYQAELTTGLDILIYIGLFGLLSGFALANSRFSRRTALLFSLVYGGFFIFWIIGNKYQVLADLSWRERVVDLLQRQGEWLNKAFNGGTSREPLIFVMHTSVIFWVIGFAAAWWTYRERRIWRAILPAGLVLLSVVYYYYGPRPLWLYLVYYILLAFVYITLTYLNDQQLIWRKSSVRFERGIGFNFAAAGFLAAMSALLVAWQVPTFAANNTVNNALSGTNPAWREVQDNWTRLFSALRSYSTATSDDISGSLSLGGPRNVSDAFIMDIFVSDELPYAYWHQISYETYVDGRWVVPDGEQTMRIPDDGLFEVPDYQAREVVTQTVRNYLPNSGQIYGLPDIVGSDKQVFVTSSPAPNGDELISMVRSRYVLPQGDVYNTYSELSRATQTDLKFDSQEYPGWIDPYLEVPEMSGRTRDLSDQLAQPYTNPYDVSIAVQNYLRANIEYNDQIEAPPEGIDVVDYLLFDLQEGYCNYYATAMVLMLRSQGIPARPAVGYASGEFLEDDNLYRVRAKDAHMWVEVFFPSYGWIPFEPTAAISVPSLPAGSNGIEDDAPVGSGGFAGDGPLMDDLPFDEGFDSGEFDPTLELPQPRNIDLSNILNLPTLLGIFLVLVAAVTSGVAYTLNRRVESDIERSYDHLGVWGKRLGLAVDQAQTPFERGEQLTAMIPDGSKPIERLMGQFVKSSYSRGRVADIEFEPLEAWQELRPLLRRESIKQGWRRLSAKYWWLP